MREQPLGPSLELPMGPRNAALRGGTARESSHWGLRWSSLWGHETLPWAGEPPCESSHWGLRWSFPWGHEALPW
eukprot:725165-Pyramimonas_sp.AAC.1